jgi:hypothetical protein
MADRPRHPNKEVEEAVAFAESKGWRWKKMGHWGRLLCPYADRDGCHVDVWSTPRNAGNHARQIVRAIGRCPHGEEDQP